MSNHARHAWGAAGGPPDPLRFVEGALALLPEDPADVSADDMARLQAVGEGLLAITEDIDDDLAALANRVKRVGVVAAAGDVAFLEARHRRGELARERLHSYAEQAALALGIPAANRAAIHHNRRRSEK
jgi:hypothetical protein